MVKLTNADKAKQKSLYDKMVQKRPQPVSHLTIHVDHLPDIKNMEVGKTHKITVKAKMISKSEGGWDGKQPLKAEFQIGSHGNTTEPSNYVD